MANSRRGRHAVGQGRQKGPKNLDHTALPHPSTDRDLNPKDLTRNCSNAIADHVAK
ncbi:MAG: hypothetical protein ACRDTD_01520 [Pseudonocardiaceae bacterium]